MKKIFFILMLLIIFPAYCSGYTIICNTNLSSPIESENMLKKISGFSFISKKTVDIILQMELNRQISPGFKTDIEIFNTNSLKKGEFKSLTIKNKNIKYRAFSASDFYAQTLCTYNKVVYQNKKIYYPNDIPFKFSAKITNSDIKSILASYEFQNELKKINKYKGIRIETPVVEIREGKIYFTIPISTFLSQNPFYIKFSADLSVENDKIVLRNINFISRSNIINVNMISSLINIVNPIAYEFNKFDSKYFTVDPQNVKTISDAIAVNGFFIIKGNYGKEK